jgi:two-component system cell cycle sensor histidine kinase PleC
MQPQADSKHVRLACGVSEGLPCVQADPARIHQVLLNLLSNAIKFTPEGGSVTVSATPTHSHTRDQGAGDPPAEETDAACVEVSVRDTGVGIALEDQQRLFQDFEQVAGGQQQGTGLGLSLTRRLVLLHGGAVGLESAPEQGSRFWFTLPVAVPEA